jgi:thiol-disulfide isomerase/thioredoxin
VSARPLGSARRLGVAVLLLCGALAQAADKGGPAVGDPAPDFKSRDAVTHQSMRLSEQTGKVVILTFWATWCAPCRKELPVLENLQGKVAKDQLIVYAVPYAEPSGSYGALVKFFRSWHLTLLDDPYGSIAKQYHIKGIPHLFLIGRDGRIAAEHTGYGEGSIESLVDDVNTALRATPPNGATEPTAAPH